MISKSRLQEFGFTDPEKFPRGLYRHAVTLSLPSAMEKGIEPLEVVIEEGLAVPLQTSSSSSGMIIRSDGTMLYVAHHDAADPASPLEARFIKDIPYDVRISVSNVMRRAVQADPSLADLWRRVSAAWTAWFPVLERDVAVFSAGEFRDIRLAWNGIADLLGRCLDQFFRNPIDLDRIRVKILVQSDMEFRKGWLGEEFLVDEASLQSIEKQGRVKYLMQHVFPGLQKVLRNPVFFPESRFRLYYGSRGVCMIKLVISPIKEQDGFTLKSAGIDFTLDTLDGASSSMD